MIGAPPINRQPFGFLSLLDIKTGGENPKQLPTFVQPTLSMDRFYEQSATYSFLTRTPAAAGAPVYEAVTAVGWTITDTPIPVTVPNNEIWLVSEWRASWLGAAAVDPLTIGFAAGGAHFMPIPQQQFTNAARLAGDTVSMGPVLLPGGSTYGIKSYTAIAATTGIDMYMRILRLPV